MTKTPPLTWFRAFEASARCLSFTGAAEELGLTQSAVSQHVRSLELRFGVVLFERLPRGLALTDEGRRMLPDVSKALNTLADVALRFGARPSGRSLTVATSISIAQWYLMPRIKEFRSSYPDIKFRIVNTTWPDEYSRPLADIEIRYGSKQMVGKNASRIKPDELIVVAAPALEVDAARLSDYPLIEAAGSSDGWGAWAQSVGYGEAIEPSLFVDAHGLAVDLARHGGGVALTSSLVAAPCLNEGSLERLDLPPAQSEDGYYLAVNDNNSPDAQAFADWFLGIVRSSV